MTVVQATTRFCTTTMTRPDIAGATTVSRTNMFRTRTDRGRVRMRNAGGKRKNGVGQKRRLKGKWTRPTMQTKRLTTVDSLVSINQRRYRRLEQILHSK